MFIFMWPTVIQNVFMARFYIMLKEMSTCTQTPRATSYLVHIDGESFQLLHYSTGFYMVPLSILKTCSREHFCVVFSH